LTLGGDSTGNIVLSDLALASAGLTVASGQNTTLASFINDGGVVYANASGVLAQTTAGNSSQCLIGGTTPSWSDCGGAAGDDWNFLNGALSPKLASVADLLLGSQSTSSAKFAFSNVAGGTPTASISAITTNNALSLDAAGNIFTTNKQSLTLGSASTGNIVIGNTGFTTCTGLETIGGVLTCGTDADSGGSNWDVSLTNGTINPKLAQNLDLLLGGTSTASAEFGVICISSGAPIATLSAT